MMNEFRKNPSTVLLVAINVCVFLLVEVTGGSDDVQHMLDCGAQYAPFVVERGEYYRLFTCMFLHFGITHLINNMLIFWFVGSTLERVVGTLRFLLIYFVGGVGASCISCYLDIIRQDYAVSAGASGAVFAVIGALLWVLLINRGRLENMTFRQILFLAALSLYLGFAGSGVDNAAHVGGFVLGFVTALLLCHRPVHLS